MQFDIQDVNVREQLLRKKNNVVFRILKTLEEMDLHPDDFSLIRDAVRLGFVLYTNAIFKALGFKEVKLWRKRRG